MTELPISGSVWWYVLAGFLLGFILSTLWEWLYFRSRRLRVENRRIAELEARVRSLTPPAGVAGAADSPIAPGAASPYQGPGVYLESEQSPGAADVITTTSTTTRTATNTATNTASGAASGTRRVQYATAASPAAPRTGSAQSAAQAGPPLTAQTPTAPPPTAQASAERNSRGQNSGARTIEQTTTYTVRPAAQTSAVQSGLTPPGTQSSSTQVVERTTTYTVRPAAQAASAQDGPLQTGMSQTGTARTADQSPALARSTTVVEAPAERQPGQKPEPKPGYLPSATGRNLAAFGESTTTQTGSAAGDRRPDTGAAQPVAPQQIAAPVQAAPAQAPVYDNGNGYASRNGFARAAAGTPEPEAQRGPTQESKAAAQAAPAQDTTDQEAQAARTAAAATAAGMAAVAAAKEAQQDASAAQNYAIQKATATAQDPTAQDPTVQGPTVENLTAQGAADQEAQAARMAAAAAAAGMAAVAAAEHAQQDVAPAAQDYATQKATATTQGPTTQGPTVQDLTAQDTTDQEAQTARVAAAAAAAGMAAVAAAEHAQQDAAPVVPAEPAAQPATGTPTLVSILPLASQPANRAGSDAPVRTTAAATQAAPPTGIQPGIQRVSGELDSLLTSLQGLIDTTDPLLDGAAGGEVQRLVVVSSAADAQATAGDDVTGPYAAHNLSRGEYAVVRLMQSVRRFGRELRSLYRWE